MMPSQKAFTLLEVLITVIIFTVGVVVILRQFSRGMVGSLDAENTTIAMHLAQQRMEEVRNLDFDTGIVNEAKAVVSGFSAFQREVVVIEPETDLKRTTVNTYWTSQADEVSVSLTTYISRN